MTCACGNALTCTYTAILGVDAVYYTYCDRCLYAPTYYTAHVVVRNPAPSLPETAGAASRPPLPYRVAGQLARLQNKRPCRGSDRVSPRSVSAADLFGRFSWFFDLFRSRSALSAKNRRTSASVNVFGSSFNPSAIQPPVVLSMMHRTTGARRDVGIFTE